MNQLLLVFLNNDRLRRAECLYRLAAMQYNIKKNIYKEGCDILNNVRGIPSYESYILNELITMRAISAAKSYSMSRLVKDDELKSILQQNLTAAKDQIKEMDSVNKGSVHSPTRAADNKDAKSVQTSQFASSVALDEVKKKEIPVKQKN